MVTARDVMTPTSGYLGQADSVATAAVMMRDLDVSSLPVCRSDGRFAGIVTARAIVIRCLAAGWDPYATSTYEVVDCDAVAVSADEPVEAALLTMAINKVHRLPVLDRGSLVGMLADSVVAQSLPDDALGQLFRRRAR
jgi:CBS domain-containing protein